MPDSQGSFVDNLGKTSKKLALHTIIRTPELLNVVRHDAMYSGVRGGGSRRLERSICSALLSWREHTINNGSLNMSAREMRF
ncbi:MAG: hypothetical protein WC495_01900 [Patescibacteria group bacterium]|jgi:hypothetical protein